MNKLLQLCSCLAMFLLDVLEWVFLHGNLGVTAIKVLYRCSKEYRKYLYENKTFWEDLRIISIHGDPRNEYIKTAEICGWFTFRPVTYPNLIHIHISFIFVTLSYNFIAPNVETITITIGKRYVQVRGQDTILVESEIKQIKEFCDRFPKLVHLNIITPEHGQKMIEELKKHNLKV